MADLARSAVVIERSWSEGGTTGKELSCRQVTLTLSGQGGTTNKIPASVLELSKIEQCSNFIKSDSAVIVVAVPSYDGANLLLADLAQGADANRDDPADFSITIRGVVKGYL